MRSKVGTSMLSVIWFAASLILARPQAARSSSSGSLEEGDIIPRSRTRPDKVNSSFRWFQIIFIFPPESCEIACLPIASILCMTAKSRNFVRHWALSLVLVSACFKYLPSSACFDVQLFHSNFLWPTAIERDQFQPQSTNCSHWHRTQVDDPRQVGAFFSAQIC